jgi:electron transport complex protein RnfC
VRPGDYVKEGLIIGRADEKGALNVHSPIPGLVTEVRRVRDASGSLTETVAIALEGSFEALGKREEYFPWKTLTRHEILHILHDKGVVDAGNESTSLYDRIVSFGESDGERSIAVSVVECDGYSRTESTVLSTRANEVLEGVEILKKALGATKTRIVVAGRPAIEAGKRIEELDPGVEIVVARPRHPQGHRSKLEESLFATFPGSHFIVSAQSAATVHDAVARNKPMLERFITVAGGAVQAPCVLKARIGTSVGDLFEECGGFVSAPEYVVVNDPFSGRSIFDLDTPIDKGSVAVLALLPGEVSSSKVQPCVRCGRCAEACPENLEPFLLFKAIDRDVPYQACELEALGIRDCIECGACAHVCPSRIPVSHAISLAKREIASKAGLQS